MDALLLGLLERQQLIGAQVALVVAGPSAGQHRRVKVFGGHDSPPVRISASFARLMFPPDTMQTIFPVPALPDSAAAGASAPAPSASTRIRSASVRTAAAASAIGTANAPSTSGCTRGHIESSTRRRPEPSTNEGVYSTSTGSPALSAAGSAAPVAGSAA